MIEDQAFGRVHRLGQTWVVEVQRLVIAGAAGEVQRAQVVLSSLNCKRPAAVSRESQKPTLYHAAAIAAQQLPSTGSKPPPPYGLHIQGSNHSHHLHRHTRSWELLRSQRRRSPRTCSGLLTISESLHQILELPLDRSSYTPSLPICRSYLLASLLYRQRERLAPSIAPLEPWS